MKICDGRSARWNKVRGWLFGAALSLCAAPAGAVMQTNAAGTTIPLQPGTSCKSNASICINENELTEGGAGDIDGVATATISQETFNPLCELTFRVVARGADYKNTFGWYAVQRDGNGEPIAPMLSDLHVFLGCNDAIGAQKTLTLPKDVGEIGFFLANNAGTCVATQDDPLGGTLTAQPANLFFSQRAFNSDMDGLIHLLVWQSRANPDAFYFGWEDIAGGGDNDFEDLLTYVTGIQCAGGGEPCQAEGEGVCGDGVLQCRDGALTCVPTQTPSPEECNALDDDCDGDTDEGDDLCKQSEICVKGHCEPRCGTGEFRCGSGEVCVQGVCIEESCATKDCDHGAVCVDGKCVAPCDDVVCPYGSTCRRGVCVDACEGIECDAGFACEPRQSSDEQTLVGVCSSCDCRGCDDGQSCVEHLCVEDACKDKTCDAGSHCVAGDCVDDCASAKCPAGQMCSVGRCIDDPNAGDGGQSNGAGGDANGNGAGGGLINPGQTGGSNNNGNGGASGSAVGDNKNSLEVKGCSCEVPGSSSSGGVALALLGLLVGARRRRSAQKRG
jgi:MYXO-CTERM domain-containing protein